MVRHSPVDEAKRWASGKGRKVGFSKARATFRGGGTGIAATAAKHDSLIKKARWRGTEQIARETPAGSVSVVTMPHRKDFASDKEHQVRFNLWLKADGFKGKVILFAAALNKTDTPNKGWEKDRVPTCASRIL